MRGAETNEQTVSSKPSRGNRGSVACRLQRCYIEARSGCRLFCAGAVVVAVSVVELTSLLARLQQGELGVEQAVEQLSRSGLVTVDDHVTAQLDLDRQRRCGFPEVVYGPGKTPETLVEILRRITQHGQRGLVTRVSPEQAVFVRGVLPATVHNPVARTLRLDPAGGANPVAASPLGKVAVITAGSSDLPVAEEAVETARFMGCEVDLIVDVGVAGPHRLPAQKHRFETADAIVVVAGMEAALPSVVGGYVSCPVFGVPTSVGYGAHLGGLAALLGMINSCAANVTVVNIDAGFKGGYLAGMIARRLAEARQR